MEEIDLHKTIDARIWAQEFLRITKEHPEVPQDEATMIGWFANAIMVGYDKGRGVEVTVLPDDSAFIAD